MGAWAQPCTQASYCSRDRRSARGAGYRLVLPAPAAPRPVGDQQAERDVVSAATQASERAARAMPDGRLLDSPPRRLLREEVPPDVTDHLHSKVLLFLNTKISHCNLAYAFIQLQSPPAPPAALPRPPSPRRASHRHESWRARDRNANSLLSTMSSKRKCHAVRGPSAAPASRGPSPRSRQVTRSARQR